MTFPLLQINTVPIVSCLKKARLVRWKSSRGTTLVEALIACTLIIAGMGAAFTVNASVLRTLKSSRESASAGQHLAQRMEQFRTAAWPVVTSATSVRTNVLQSSTTDGRNLPLAAERIVALPYPVPSPAPAPTRLRRLANGSVVIESVNDTLASSDAILLNIQVVWQSTFQSRTRVRETSTVIARKGVLQ